MFAMTMRQRFAVASAAVLGVPVALGALAWFGALTPSAPSGWAQVHAGMERDAVLSLAGQPQQSGWPEKIVETWDRSGLICRHRLLVALPVIRRRGDVKTPKRRERVELGCGGA